MKSKNELFQEKLNRMYPDTYLLKSEYKNNKEKVLIKHIPCGYEWYVRPDEFNRAYKAGREMCPSCSGKTGGKTMTHNQFVERIERYFPGEYTFLNTYKDHTTSMRIKHKCGTIFNRTANNFNKSLFRGKGSVCPGCQNKNVGRQRNLKIMTEKAKIVIDENIYNINDFSSEYKNVYLLESNLPLLKSFEAGKIDNFGIIYGHQSKSTNKWYIGQTTMNRFLKRWSAGSGYLGKDNITGKYKQKKIAMAIEKYGWDDFKHYIFAICSAEKLDHIETELIKVFDSVKNGYNISAGGTGTYQLRGTKRLDVSENRSGKDNPTSKKVCMLDYNTNEILKVFDTITEAAKSINAEGSRNVISQVCKGTKDSAAGYKWKYFEEGDPISNTLDDATIMSKKFNRSRKVSMLDLQTKEVLKVFNSIQEGADYISLPSSSNINNVLDGTANQAGGFFWRESLKSDKDSSLSKDDILKRAFYRIKKIAMIDTNTGHCLKEFDTSYDAAAFLGVNDSSNIRSACRGKRDTAYGFRWGYSNELPDGCSILDIKKEDIDKYRANRTEIIVKKVYQYSKTGEYIQSFESISDAQFTLRIGHISDCCNGKCRTAGGYIWSFKKCKNILKD